MRTARRARFALPFTTSFISLPSRAFSKETGTVKTWLFRILRNIARELDAQDKVFELGGAGDVPVVGDWNDDGTDDPGVYQPGAAMDRLTRRAG